MLSPQKFLTTKFKVSGSFIQSFRANVDLLVGMVGDELTRCSGLNQESEFKNDKRTLGMEVFSQKVTVDNLTVEISIHDLSFRMGFEEGDIPMNHLYVSLTARDHCGMRIWSTPILTDDGKVKAYSTISDALSDAKARIGANQDLKTG